MKPTILSNGLGVELRTPWLPVLFGLFLIILVLPFANAEEEHIQFGPGITVSSLLTVEKHAEVRTTALRNQVSVLGASQTVSFILRGPKNTCEIYDDIRNKHFRLDFTRFACRATGATVSSKKDNKEPTKTLEFRVFDLAEAKESLQHELTARGIRIFNDVRFFHTNKYVASIAEGAGGAGDRDSGWFRSQDITGDGEVVGIVDSGLNTRHCFFANEKVKIYAGANTTDESGHGTHVSSTACGGLPDSSPVIHAFSGVAAKSQVAFYDIDLGDDDYLDVPSDFAGSFYATLNAVGARILSNSWGGLTDYTYNVFVRRADEAHASYPGVLGVFAVGNDGPPRSDDLEPRSLAPSVALSVLSVGATMKSQEGLIYVCTAFPTRINCGNIYSLNQLLLSEESLADFSSAGSGGLGLRQISPDVVLPGAWTIGSSVNGSGSCPREPTDSNNDFTLSSGTSMATPAVSGLGALIRQYANSRSQLRAVREHGQLLRAAILHTVDRMRGYAFVREEGDEDSLTAVRFKEDYWPNVFAGFGRAGSRSDILEHSWAFHGSVSKTKSACYRVERGNLSLSDMRATLAYVPETLPAYGEARPHMYLRETLNLYVHESNSGALLNANTMEKGISHRDVANNVQQVWFGDAGSSSASVWLVEVNYPRGAASSQGYDLIISGANVTETTCSSGISQLAASSDGNLWAPQGTSDCLNGCSGHGSCTQDGCSCDDGYGGADCSFRVIPLELRDDTTVSVGRHESVILQLSNDSKSRLGEHDWVLDVLPDDISHPFDSNSLTVARNQQIPATLAEVTQPCSTALHSLNGTGDFYVMSVPVARENCAIILTNADSQWDGSYSIKAVPANESLCAEVSCGGHGTCVSGQCYCDVGFSGPSCSATGGDGDGGDGNGALRLGHGGWSLSWRFVGVLLIGMVATIFL